VILLISNIIIVLIEFTTTPKAFTKRNGDVMIPKSADMERAQKSTPKSLLHMTKLSENLIAAKKPSILILFF